MSTEVLLKNIVAAILTEAKQLGADSAEVSATISNGFSVQVRKAEVETLEYHDDKGFSVTVYCGQSQGSASTTDTRFEAIKSTVLAAYNIAKYTQPDPDAGLAEQELMAFNYPNLDLYYPWAIKPEMAIELAIACETRGLQADKRITNSDGVSISTQTSFSAYGNTHGFIGIYPSTYHEINSVLIASMKGDMQRDNSYSVARDPNELWDINFIADQAVERTLSRLQPQTLSTRAAPVIFINEVARGLLGHFVSAIRGASLYRKSSLYYEKLGHTIFPTWFNLYEQPHLLKAIGSTPFDADGLATSEKFFIEKGVLTNYALGTYSARKLGMKSTGNADGTHNLSLITPKETFNSLLKKMDTGLLVTELMGQGINITTGDYSRGASGFWVEKGIIQYPVHQITIAGNLRDMFANIVAVADDVDVRGNIRTGSILIENMMIAGK